MAQLLEKLTKIPVDFSQRGKGEFFKTIPISPGVYIYFKGDTVLYIGKAINLKRRISSYFDMDLDTKTSKMISEANFVSYIQVDSELEALLLEAKLIRSYMPFYNIIAKDDKHPLYIIITNEEFPRIISARKVFVDQTKPLASFGPFPSSANVRSVLRLIRRIFPYSDHKTGKRPCLYSNIGLCNPCPSEISQSLEPEVLRKKYIKNIRNIKSILSGNVDRLTRMLASEMESASKNQAYEDAILIRNQINQIEYITRPQMPSEFYIENPNLYEDQRKKESEELFKILNSKIKLKNLDRIECFDIAHLAGTNATASMVTFVNGEADKEYYRHFKIKKAKGGDDYESMREVARRRLNHLNDWGKPDLIIVDGGVGQVASFRGILLSGGIDIPVVGIAKHPDRLIIDKNKILLTHLALKLVSRIRNEAHRFARRYHHGLISKSINKANKL